MANKPHRRTAASTAEAPQVENQSELPNDKDSTQTDTASQLPMTKDGEPGVDHYVPGSDPSNAEKKSVKTSGSFSLIDPWTGKHIDAKSEGTEVVVTTFIRDKLDSGELLEA